MTNIQAELIVKKSTFLSFIYKVDDKTQIKSIISALKKEHKKARHVCYAYQIIKDGVENAGFSDDGEPSNSAGRPIYELIRIKNISNVIIVVVRYFGGIMLGFGGLQKAYRESAKIVIEKYLENLKEETC
ncbi:hypothetical protein MCANUFG4_02845 [Mycoplasmopsis canis UFG4]|uniref:Impact N-terminal domain-containing protein n=1 Tax=Mycoplasmopsis canis UFG4 TaxID=1131455 RepID=I1A4H5_9BACT|nr:YigZ family protein [Mycoplasmopsis canis]AKF41405.1 proline dipeptidase [Mycoplasmopsis canis]EIE41396.1 hypothetical protein MCANUFG4_02845 [Mycoplasmopsis canis UFG4]WQQ12726.1 YigZ family protein [Mycoplasmopsis canis]